MLKALQTLTVARRRDVFAFRTAAGTVRPVMETPFARDAAISTFASAISVPLPSGPRELKVSVAPTCTFFIAAAPSWAVNCETLSDISAAASSSPSSVPPVPKLPCPMAATLPSNESPSSCPTPSAKAVLKTLEIRVAAFLSAGLFLITLTTSVTTELIFCIASGPVGMTLWAICNAESAASVTASASAESPDTATEFTELTAFIMEFASPEAKVAERARVAASLLSPPAGCETSGPSSMALPAAPKTSRARQTRK
mmetsp:Transcript_70948/g.114420  ORF Transcript_70948/g.114420 Transcript_70948/m.114420 type:complete len:256 (-) Transcript_70948:3517-4284(-)